MCISDSDIADAVFEVDQIGVHQGVAQDGEAVAAVIAKAGDIQPQCTEDALGFGVTQGIWAQGGDRAEELFVLHLSLIHI